MAFQTVEDPGLRQDGHAVAEAPPAKPGHSCNCHDGDEGGSWPHRGRVTSELAASLPRVGEGEAGAARATLG
jgi:hypothetical protein